jgi:uncharacterized protein
MDERTKHLIADLELEAHPEGGYYRQVFRSDYFVKPNDERSERRAITAILFLLPAGQFSRWHRLTSDEVWSHLEGDPVSLHLFDAKTHERSTLRLGEHGPDTEPIRAVPAGVWEAAEPLGTYALLGCFVAPGFEFSDFTLAIHDLKIANVIRLQGETFARLL